MDNGPWSLQRNEMCSISETFSRSARDQTKTASDGTRLAGAFAPQALTLHGPRVFRTRHGRAARVPVGG